MRESTGRVLLIFACSLLAVSVVPRETTAQTDAKKESWSDRIKKAAKKVDKFVCGADGTACEPQGTSAASDGSDAARQTGQQGGTTGSRLRILSPGTFENADSYSAKFDTAGSGLTRESRPCSELSRPCIAGWDLRVLTVAAPADTVPNNADFPVLIGIENRGRLPSPASEVKVCITSEYSTDCERGVGLVEIPSLKAGERLLIKRPVRLTANESSFRIAALIDPDNANGERLRDNNNGASGKLGAGAPEIDWITFETSPSIRSRSDAQVFNVRIRNKSFSTKTPPTEIAFGMNNGCGGDARYATPLPAIGPRQIYSIRVAVLCDQGNGYAGVEIHSSAIGNPNSPNIFVNQR